MTKPNPLIPGPIVTSHQGKTVLLHPDGKRTNLDGSPIVDKEVKLPTPQPKRFHQPYD